MPALLQVATMSWFLRAFLMPISKHFRGLGWTVDGAANGASTCPDCASAFNRVWEVDFARSPTKLPNLINGIRGIRELVKREGYDLVHVHTPVAAFATRFALRGLRKRGATKVIYTAHGFHFFKGNHPGKNALFFAAEKLAGRWMDFLVVINSEDYDAAIRRGIVPRDRVLYMPGGASGLDPSVHSVNAVTDEQVERLRTEIGLEPGVPLFTMVAEFIPRKRHEDIVRAVALLAGKNRQVCLALAGGGRKLGDVRNLCYKLNVQDKVKFLGYRRDIPTLMRASVATVLPSGQEGCPRCVMESMSLEVPVIGSNIRGTRDLLSSGAGTLVGVGDVEGIAGAMERLIDNQDEARAMGRAGCELARDFELSGVLNHHEHLYSLALRFPTGQESVVAVHGT